MASSIDQQFLRDSPVIATGLLSVWFVNNQTFKISINKNIRLLIFSITRLQQRMKTTESLNFIKTTRSWVVGFLLLFDTKPQGLELPRIYNTEIYFLPETLLWSVYMRKLNVLSSHFLFIATRCNQFPVSFFFPEQLDMQHSLLGNRNKKVDTVYVSR